MAVNPEFKINDKQEDETVQSRVRTVMERAFYDAIRNDFESRSAAYLSKYSLKIDDPPALPTTTGYPRLFPSYAT